MFYSQGKTVLFSPVQEWLAASDLFHMFTQSIKFYYTFHYHILRVQIFEKCKNDSKNDTVKMNTPSGMFYSKIWVGFCLNTGKVLSFKFERFHFKAKRKSIGSSKNGTRDFQNSPLFERSTF